MGQRARDRQWPMPPVVRHVWVQSPEHHQPPDPGLLVAWERIGGDWWAWVVTAMDRPGRSPTIIQRWYHQRDVTAAPTRPQSPDPGRWHRGWLGEDRRPGPARGGG